MVEEFLAKNPMAVNCRKIGDEILLSAAEAVVKVFARTFEYEGAFAAPICVKRK